jgi:hypothetical protein
MPFTQQELGVAIGWAVGVTVYIALAYLTFVHDWSKNATLDAT